MTNQQLVEKMDEILFGWAYRDIERASIYGEAKLAGFILGACFIDALAGFYEGVDRNHVKNNSSRRFTNFVKKYLSEYDAQKLWTDLRCGLVHSYAAGTTYAFTDANKAGFHFSKAPNGMLILNLEDFLADLRKAYSKLRDDILTDKKIFNNALKRYESMWLMGLTSMGK
jgi:hypothetical protein